MINSYKRLIEEGKFGEFFRRLTGDVDPGDKGRTDTSKAPDRNNDRRRAAREWEGAERRGKRPKAWSVEKRNFMRSLGLRR